MKAFERIDRLRREWSDKYVEVDAGVPALRRFAGRIGRVMTVNMNGRALVQFAGTNDIGWYDIDPARLRIVAAPPLERQATAGQAKPKAPPRDVAEASIENVRKASAEAEAATFADETVDSLAAESAIQAVAAPGDTGMSDDAVDSLAATEAPVVKPSVATDRGDASSRAPQVSTPDVRAATSAAPKPSVEEILAEARPKHVPGFRSEPGKNPPERRNSAPDLGEEEV